MKETDIGEKTLVAGAALQTSQAVGGGSLPWLDVARVETTGQFWLLAGACGRGR